MYLYVYVKFGGNNILMTNRLNTIFNSHDYNCEQRWILANLQTQLIINIENYCQ